MFGSQEGIFSTQVLWELFETLIILHSGDSFILIGYAQLLRTSFPCVHPLKRQQANTVVSSPFPLDLTNQMLMPWAEFTQLFSTVTSLVIEQVLSGQRDKLQLHVFWPTTKLVQSAH